MPPSDHPESPHAPQQQHRTIWLISDTHGHHETLTVPHADAVIHLGDEANRRDPAENLPQSMAFFDWFAALPITDKFFVPGNHSAAIESGLLRPDNYPSINFLIHRSTTWHQWNLFGSPYTPRHGEWSYMRKRSDLDQIWSTISTKTDLLLTHTPPRGVLDLTRSSEGRGLVQAGCTALRRHVETRIRPAVHVFGHLHDERHITNHGTFTTGATHYINAAICDRQCRPKHNGWLLTIDPQDSTAAVQLRVAQTSSESIERRTKIT